MFRKVLVFSLLAALMAGCIKEDREDCGSFRLQFHYTNNVKGENLFGLQVKDIRVYVFDRNTDVLTDIIRPSKQDIARGFVETDLPPGLYTFVAWGGSGEDMMQGGYLDAEMGNPATQTYVSPARVGGATLGNFRMMLADNRYSDNDPEEYSPLVQQFDDLFFAMAQDVTVIAKGEQTVDFDFIKNTSMLNITVTGLSYLTNYSPDPGRSLRASVTGQPLDIFIRGGNGIYEYNNRIGDHTPLLRYDCPYGPPAEMGANVEVADIKVQRLDIERYLVEPVMLYIRHPFTNQDVIPPLNIVKAILQIRDSQGNLVYRTQEDVDRQDEFSFEISILSDLSVRITVNEFEIVNTTPDVSRP